jgi:hypothetical protein
MPLLPTQPDLDQLRRQAKELLRAAQTGDTTAIARIQAVSDELTLAAAQLALAREYGFASWPRLKDEVDARALALSEKADEFIQASISGNTRRAVHMLEETPALAGYSFATAVILGDAGRVSAELQDDPTLASVPTHAPAGPRSTPPAPHAGIRSNLSEQTASPPSRGGCSKQARIRRAPRPCGRAAAAAGDRCAA